MQSRARLKPRVAAAHASVAFHAPKLEQNDACLVTSNDAGSRFAIVGLLHSLPRVFLSDPGYAIHYSSALAFNSLFGS